MSNHGERSTESDLTHFWLEQRQTFDMAVTTLAEHASNGVGRMLSQMPFFGRRPSLGYSGVGKIESSAIVAVYQETDEADEVVALLGAPNGQTFGRPLSYFSDYGVPERATEAESYLAFKVPLLRDQVAQEIYGLPAGEQNWLLLENINPGGGNIHPDALYLANKIVFSLALKPEQQTTSWALGTTAMWVAAGPRKL